LTKRSDIDGWINHVQNRAHCWAATSRAMDFHVQSKHNLASCATVHFPVTFSGCYLN